MPSLQLLEIVQAFGIATASATLLSSFVALPFSPALFWSWRLRKHSDTVKTLDSQRYPRQLDVLDQRTEYLVSKVAAAYRVPTNWRIVRYMVFWIVYSVVMAVQWLHIPWPESPGGEVLEVAFIAVAVQAVVLFFAAAWRGLAHTRSERARFIASGCPTGFVVRRRRRPAGSDPSTGIWDRYIDRAYRPLIPPSPYRRRVKQRRRQLRREGNMPASWRSVGSCRWFNRKHREPAAMGGIVTVTL
jgi:hypothetical protein